MAGADEKVVSLAYEIHGRAASAKIMVRKTPKAQITVTPDSPPTGRVTFTSSWDGGTSGCEWDFGDGSATANGTEVTHDYAKAGTYKVKLTVTQDPCRRSSVALTDVKVSAPTIAVENGPASGEYKGPDTTPYRILVTPEGGTLSIAGSPSRERVFTPSVFAPAGGAVREVKLNYVFKGLEVATTLKVYRMPSADFHMKRGQGAEYGVFLFEKALDEEGCDCQWSFGDGGTGAGASVSHEYGTDGNFQITLTVTNGPCTATVTKDLAVTPPPPELSIARSAFCGDDTQAYPLMVAPAGGVLSGEGIVGQSFVPAEVVIPPGTKFKPVRLAYRYKSRDAVADVTVHAVPVATFKGTLDPQSGRLVVTADEAMADAYEWKASDGKTSQGSPAQFLLAAGVSTRIELVVRNGTCTKTGNQEFTWAGMRPTITIGEGGKSSFCNGDSGQYSIEVSPPGGRLSGPGVHFSNNAYIYQPCTVSIPRGNSRKCTLEYVVGEQKATLEILVHRRAVADFIWFPTDNGWQTKAVERGLSSYTWRIHNIQPPGTPAVLLSPQLPQATSARLAVVNGECQQQAMTSNVMWLEIVNIGPGGTTRQPVQFVMESYEYWADDDQPKLPALGYYPDPDKALSPFDAANSRAWRADPKQISADQVQGVIRNPTLKGAGVRDGRFYPSQVTLGNDLFRWLELAFEGSSPTGDTIRTGRTVVVRRKPVAKFVFAVVETPEGKLVEFTAEPTLCDVYTWDMGDGAGPVTGPCVRRRLAGPKTYEVTLKVRYGRFEASATQAVSVPGGP